MYRRTVWEKESSGTASVPPGYRGEIIGSAKEPVGETDSAVSEVTAATSSLGFPGGVTADDLLLCALIIILASDRRENIEDVVLVLALLLAVR